MTDQVIQLIRTNGNIYQIRIEPLKGVDILIRFKGNIYIYTGLKTTEGYEIYKESGVVNISVRKEKKK